MDGGRCVCGGGGGYACELEPLGKISIPMVGTISASCPGLEWTNNKLVVQRNPHTTAFLIFPTGKIFPSNC